MPLFSNLPRPEMYIQREFNNDKDLDVTLSIHQFFSTNSDISSGTPVVDCLSYIPTSNISYPLCPIGDCPQKHSIFDENLTPHWYTCYTWNSNHEMIQHPITKNDCPCLYKSESNIMTHRL